MVGAEHCKDREPGTTTFKCLPGWGGTRCSDSLCGTEQQGYAVPTGLDDFVYAS